MPGRDLAQRATDQVAGMRRDPANARVAGLCAALAQRTGIDVRLVRIGMVVLALSGGMGVALYACGWLLVPMAGSDTVPLAHVLPGVARWDGRRRLTLTAVVAVVTWLLCGSWLPFGPVPIILALIMLLVHRQRRAGDIPQQPVSPSPTGQVQPGALPRETLDGRDLRGTDPGRGDFHTAVTAWQARVQQVHGQYPTSSDGRPSYDSGPYSGPYARPASGALADLAAQPLVPPTPRGATRVPGTGRRRRGLGTVVGLAVAVLAGLVGWITTLATEHYRYAPGHAQMLGTAAALAVTGIALLAFSGTRIRPRVLVPLGVVLTLWLGCLQLGLMTDRGDWTSGVRGTGTTSQPLRVVGVDSTQALPSSAIGSTVDVRIRAAKVVITVPDGAAAHVLYQLRAANLTVGTTVEGGNAEGQLDLAATGSGKGTIVIRLDAVASDVEVRHA